MGTDPGSEDCHGHPMILASPRLKPRSWFIVVRNRGRATCRRNALNTMPQQAAAGVAPNSASAKDIVRNLIA